MNLLADIETPIHQTFLMEREKIGHLF